MAIRRRRYQSTPFGGKYPIDRHLLQYRVDGVQTAIAIRPLTQNSVYEIVSVTATTARGRSSNRHIEPCSRAHCPRTLRRCFKSSCRTFSSAAVRRAGKICSMCGRRCGNRRDVPSCGPLPTSMGIREKSTVRYACLLAVMSSCNRRKENKNDAPFPECSPAPTVPRAAVQYSMFQFMRPTRPGRFLFKCFQ